jgi:predicted MFS family arabinose efflux permease
MFMTFTAVATFFPAFLEKMRGFSSEQASAITSGMPLAGLIGCLIVGSLSGVTGLRRPFMWPMMALSLLGMIAAAISANTLIITLGVCAVGFGISAYIPMIFTFLMDLPGATLEMVAGGVALTMGVSMIATLADSWIFNALASRVNLSGAFLFFGALLMFSLFLSLALPETGPGKAKK